MCCTVCYSVRKFLNFPHLDNTLKILQGFESISLVEMDSVALLDRHDTKYILTPTDLDSVLSSMNSEYRILEVGGLFISRYETLYFDSDSMLYYDLHQRGKMNRVKVRMRKYCSTGVTFLEVKLKNNLDRTVKLRKEIEDLRHELTPDDLEFIKAACGEQPPLKPRVSNSFERITLVHSSFTERLTIDRALSFSDLHSQEQSIDGLVVVELKQVRFDRESKFAREAKRRLIRPNSISKYCLGVGLLYTGVRKNFINMKLRAIEKLEPSNLSLNLPAA